MEFESATLNSLLGLSCIIFAEAESKLNAGILELRSLGRILGEMPRWTSKGNGITALTGVMSPLISKLTNLMGEEYAKLKGVRKQVNRLRKELMAINVMLEKYVAIEKPDVQVKAWTKEVRELAYDIEDRIDLFTFHADHEEQGGFGNTSTGVKRILRKNIAKLKNLHHRHKFAAQIQELLVLVNEVCERQKRYKLEEITCIDLHTKIDPRLPALYVEVEKLVGIQDPTEEIINLLIGQKSGKMKQRRIVSIVGPGGSGKSTLANQVYQKINSQFTCKAFVSVSQKCNMNSFLWELLSEIQRSCGISDHDHQSASSYSNQQLINRLRNLLTDKGYMTFGVHSIGKPYNVLFLEMAGK
uniref:Rx N-terminal domain-containing protein n=1 Tax=Leersia perrieri TaxID=77586 RepID=A0A0D9XQN5_9ORYZ